jgi:TPR repeat protein
MVERKEKRANGKKKADNRKMDGGGEYALGRMYFLGDGVLADERVAASWYKKAAERGHTGAHRALGRMYSCGAGVERDYAAAASMLRTAAQRGDAGAQCALAEVLYHNAPESRAAVMWYESSAAQGNAEAACALAHIQTSRM